MAKRKLKRIERIILISFCFSAVILVAFWLMDKEPDRDFYIPKNYHGWLTVRYGVEGAAPLKLKDGVQQILFSDSGYAETSDVLIVGWRKDRYFWLNEDGTSERIPPSVEMGDSLGIYLHHHAYYAKNHENLLASLPIGTDTILPDETRLIKESENKVEYTRGKKTLEYFFLSKSPESIMYNPPKNPKSEALEKHGRPRYPIKLKNYTTLLNMKDVLPQIDFNNTQLAFRARSDKRLKKDYWLFRMVDSPFLTWLGPKLINFAFALRLPIKGLVRNTLFTLFCGGESLEENR